MKRAMKRAMKASSTHSHAATCTFFYFLAMPHSGTHVQDYADPTRLQTYAIWGR